MTLCYEAILEDNFDIISSWSPRAFDIGAPASINHDQTFTSLNLLQPDYLTLQFATIIVEAYKDLCKPGPIQEPVIDRQLDKNISRSLYIKLLGDNLGIVLIGLIIATLVVVQLINLKRQLWMTEFRIGRDIFNIEILSRNLLAIDIDFPTILTLFPKRSSFLMTPTFSDMKDMILFLYLLLNIQRCDKILTLIVLVAFYFGFEFPGLSIK